MTSPRADKPSRKTKDYQEVHSRGSSFGQNLNESKVRELLSTEVQSPFAQFVIGIGERFASFAADIANAIKGEGAKYTVITGAVDERLGPIDTSITETGKRLTDMELEVGESIREQDKLIEESKKTLEETGRRIAEAEQAVEDLRSAEERMRNEVALALRDAEQAQESADGKSKSFYGSTTPKEPRPGDVWFKPTENGTVIMQFDGTKWVNRSDTKKYEAQLAEAKSAVAEAKAEVKRLTEVTLPDLEEELSKIGEGTDEFNRRLKDESDARKRELKKLSSSLGEAKSSLGGSMRSLESSLKESNKQLKEQERELSRVGYASPGNVWPDPHFQDPCWKVSGAAGSNSNNGGELRLVGLGRQTGTYYQPKGLLDKAIMLEKGGKYLLTATVYRSSKFPAGGTISVHMRQPGKYIGRVATLPVGPVGLSVESVILDIRDTIVGGGSTLGFFLEREVKGGSVSIWDVQLVRAADNAMIIDGAISTPKVQAGAIEASKIATNAVTADKIRAGAITAGKIATNSVTASKIVAGTITAKELGSNSVTTKQLTANSVNSSALQANSVKAEHLVANQITGDKISANTITGENVRANSLTANELQIRPGNMFPDPNFQDPCWGTTGNAYAHPNNGGELRMYAAGRQVGRYYQPKGFKDSAFMLEEGATYRLSATVYTGNKALAKQDISIYARYIDRSGGVSITRVGKLPIDGRGRSTPSCEIQMPDQMRDGTCTLGFFLESWHKEGMLSLWNVQMVRAADASLIVDGSILARHIKAGAITSGKIAAGSITAKEIKSGTITTGQLRSDVLTSDNLTVRNGFISNAMIANGAITNAKIANLDAGKITSGVIDARRIKADSITVTQLRANTIVPIGGSLIHHEPPPDEPTKPPEPIWWQVMDSELPANYSGWPRPEGNPWRMSRGAQSKGESPSVPKRLVKVKPGQNYKLRLWARALKQGSKLFIEMRDQDGSLVNVYNAPYGDNGRAPYKHDSVNKWDVADFDKNFKDGIVDPKKARKAGYLVDNYQLHDYPTLITATVCFEEHVEYVYLSRFFFNHPNSDVKTNQWIAGLSLELDIPDQKQVDEAQDTAIRSLEKNQALDEKFKAEQRKQNALNNSQLMIHKDLLELLDIRTPKVMGWPAGEGTPGQVVTNNPYSKYGAAPHVAHSYFETWEYEKELYVACRGQWVGQIRVSINWDNGAIDDWSVHVKENERIFCFVGGATHIKKRYITVTVYPRSLMRTCTVSIRKGNPSPKLGVGGRNQLWDTYNYKDINRLIRVKEMNLLRLKNTVTCNRNVVVTTPSGGKRTIKAGEPIDAADLYPEYQLYTGPYTFKELDDPVKNDYRADPTLPSGKADVIHA